MARATIAKVPAKLKRLREFADMTFPDEEHHFQWWSPYVSAGAAITRLDQLRNDWTTAGRSLEFVVNDEYTRRVGQLIEHARENSSTTNEPAYRMLQMLTRLRGIKPAL